MTQSYPYEQITNLAPSKAVRKSDEALSEGWARRQYETLDLTKSIPWALTDPALRSWNFYIHSLDMIDALLAAHSQTGEQKYLTPALRIGLDWAGKHPRAAEDVSPMAWYDMAVGLRAYRLGYLFQAADQAGLLDVAQKTELWASLHEHRVELTDDANIAFHNNHGYFQVAGQLALGRRFQQVSQPMDALHDQGAHRLKRMLDQQFGVDGVHREHSPDYHRMVADTLLGLVRAGLVEDPELLGRVDSIENALAWFVTPEGTIANFGDSDSRKMIYSAEGASRKWTTPLMRAVASNGATGKGWPKGLRQFPVSGYVMVRCPDPIAADDISQDSYLAQTAAFHSRTHKHCDDLSFIWYEGGQPLLVDAGRYGYIGKTETGSDLWQEGFWYSDPMRMFMEATRAHNTLEFDGLNAQRKRVKPYGSALVQACQKSGVYCIETRCKQHGSIRHDRLLLLQPGQWLVVFDVYSDNLKAPHDVRQWFHLAPGHRAAQVSGGYDVGLKGNGQMALRSLIGAPDPGPVITGREADPIQGWWSDKERNVIPADALCFTQTGQAKGVFATLLTLSAGDDVMVEQGRSNVSGRKAQLAWSDYFGHHSIKFERGEDLFILDYSTQLGTPNRAQSKKALDSEMEKVFSKASVVLEYGAALAPLYMASVKDLRVFCAIRDPNSAAHVRQKASANAEALIIYQGKEGGHTIDGIRRFAAEIWEQSWFLHPDIVVINGPDAIACLAEVQSHVTRKTTVIWRNFEAHPRHAHWRESIYGGKNVAGAFVFDIVPLTFASGTS